jgi:hypothetical protein
MNEYVITLIAVHLLGAIYVFYAYKKNPRRDDDE